MHSRVQCTKNSRTLDEYLGLVNRMVVLVLYQGTHRQSRTTFRILGILKIVDITKAEKL